jgi:hypothetical protein
MADQTRHDILQTARQRLSPYVTVLPEASDPCRFRRGDPTSGAWQQARPELLVLAPGSVSDRGPPVRVISERASSRGPSGWAGLA